MAWRQKPKKEAPSITYFQCPHCKEKWNMYSKNVTPSSTVCPSCGKTGEPLQKE
jgi:transcription elongation factor Elf1